MAMRVIDMLLTEIEKTNGKASLIKSVKDLPTEPNPNHLRIFLDLEGGASIQIDPEPGYPRDRRLALLRDFFRLGVRGMQLTHHGRNQLADGDRLIMLSICDLLMSCSCCNFSGSIAFTVKNGLYRYIGLCYVTEILSKFSQKILTSII